MPNALQLYLSPRPPRTYTAHDKRVKGIYNACEAWFEKQPDGTLYLFEQHFVSTHPKAQGGFKAESGPPGHIHLKQAEYFVVQEGTLGLIREGKTTLLKPGDAEYRVPPGARHRFWPHEGGGKSGNMVVKIRVDQYPGGLDESFIRNAFSYMADCDKHNVPLSGMQLMLMLYHYDMLLDIPLPVPLLHVLHWFLCYVVAWRLLGYRASYPEYYDDGKDRVKLKKEL